MNNSSKTLSQFTHEVIKSLGIRANKTLGQNFLVSDRNRNKTIDLINPKSDDIIIEIGGGLGALSFPLAESKADLTVYEIDEKLKEFLVKQLGQLSESVFVTGDFLENYPPADLPDRGFKITGNIPYNLTSPILDKIYSAESLPSETVLMVQREVADRIDAAIGTKARGRLTIWCDYHAEISNSFNVQPGAFFPVPQVGSRVIKMVTRQNFPFEPERKKRFFEMVKQSFSMKRKTLLNNLSKWKAEINKTEIEMILVRLDINPRIRAEEISLKQFIDIFNALS